jgi:hypothetical protein
MKMEIESSIMPESSALKEGCNGWEMASELNIDMEAT